MSDQPEQPFEGKKLFAVEIEKTIFVLASHRHEAEEIAHEEAGCGGHLEWEGGDVFAIEAESVPKDWRNAIPFGLHKSDATCAQILEAWAEYEQTRPVTQAELEAAGQMRLETA